MSSQYSVPPDQYYIQVMHYRFYGRKRLVKSRKMFPRTYGPFKTEEQAWEWARQKGVLNPALVREPTHDNIDVKFPTSER